MLAAADRDPAAQLGSLQVKLEMAEGGPAIAASAPLSSTPAATTADGSPGRRAAATAGLRGSGDLPLADQPRAALLACPAAFTSE